MIHATKKLSAVASNSELNRLLIAHEKAYARLGQVGPLGDAVALRREPTAEEQRIVDEACEAKAEALKAVMRYPASTLEEAAEIAAYFVDESYVDLDIADLAPFLERLASFASRTAARNAVADDDSVSLSSSRKVRHLRSDFETNLDHQVQMARLHETQLDALMRKRKQDGGVSWKVEITPEERDMIDFATADLVERARALNEAWFELEAAETNAHKVRA